MTDVQNLNQVQAKGYTFISGGLAYNLTLEFYPDYVEVYNYTQSGTTAKIVKSTWFKGFPAGDAISIQSVTDNGATGNVSSALETTNGFTWAGVAAGFTDQHLTANDATDASTTIEITTTAVHGLVDGDRVYLTDFGGKTEINDREFQVDVTSTTKFILQDFKGNNIDGTSYTTYTSGGKVNKIDESVAIADSNETYVLTMGSAVVGANSDVMYVNCIKYLGGIEDLGDIG